MEKFHGIKVQMPVVLLVCFPFHAERILLGLRVFNDPDLLHLAMDRTLQGLRNPCTK